MWAVCCHDLLSSHSSVQTHICTFTSPLFNLITLFNMNKTNTAMFNKILTNIRSSFCQVRMSPLKMVFIAFRKVFVCYCAKVLHFKRMVLQVWHWCFQWNSWQHLCSGGLSSNYWEVYCLLTFPRLYFVLKVCICAHQSVSNKDPENETKLGLQGWQLLTSTASHPFTGVTSLDWCTLKRKEWRCTFYMCKYKRFEQESVVSMHETTLTISTTRTVL